MNDYTSTWEMIKAYAIGTRKDINDMFEVNDAEIGSDRLNKFTKAYMLCYATEGLAMATTLLAWNNSRDAYLLIPGGILALDAVTRAVIHNPDHPLMTEGLAGKIREHFEG